MENEIVKISGTEIKVGKLSELDEKQVINAFFKFVDVANTSTDRATAYNTKEEQRKSAIAIHNNLFNVNRGLYGVSLLFEGITDFTKMVGVEKLLSDVSDRDESTINLETETKIIIYLLNHLPVQRVLNLFLQLKADRINNSRTRRIILSYIINAGNIERWSIKYRKKIKTVLEHAWGKRLKSIIASILTKKEERWNPKENTIIINNIIKYNYTNPSGKVYECLGFILGNEDGITLSYLKSFIDARTDIKKGKDLPREVLEGIRGTYHKDTVTKEEVLKLTAKNLTEKEKLKVQKKAKAANIKIEFDVTKQQVVDLYVHAYADGMTEEIRNALDSKAKKASLDSPISYAKIGIVMDASGSTSGDKTQNLRPIAISQSIRDMLQSCARDSFVIEYAGGKERNGLVYPHGETNLAKPFVKVLKENPDVVFLITDGYENAPAGRVNEIVEALPNMGIDTTIFQITPVMSAEASGIKSLSEKISTIPANNPNSLGMGMVKAMLESNVKEGVIGIFKVTLPKLKSKNK